LIVQIFTFRKGDFEVSLESPFEISFCYTNSMLYFFYGESQKSNEKAKGLVDKMLEKKPDAEFFVIDEENLSQGLLQEMTQSSALFQNKYIVRIKRIEDKAKKEILMDFLKELKESENIFVWSEGEINKTDLKKVEKFAEKIIEVKNSLSSKKQSDKGNIFEICNYLVNRDKKGKLDYL
jgi:DNA polymerase III delta subunit